MTLVLYVACAVSAALIVLTAVFVRTRSYASESKELASVGETKATLLLSVLLVGVSFLLCWAKVDNPSLAGDGDTSWLIVAAVAVGLTALGCVTAVFALVSRVIATDGGIESVGPFGSVTKIAWGDVVSVTPSSLSKVVKVESVDGTTISINSAMPSFGRFVEVAQGKTKKKQGKAQLADLERRLSRKG